MIPGCGVNRRPTRAGLHEKFARASQSRRLGREVLPELIGDFFATLWTARRRRLRRLNFLPTIGAGPICKTSLGVCERSYFSWGAASSEDYDYDI